MPTTLLRTSDGRLDADDATLLDDLDQRLSEGPRKVLLYLHGGLVDENSAREMAIRLSGKGQTSLNVGEDWEQVYVLWRTGIRETLSANWLDIFENDRLYRALLKRLVSFFSGHLADGGQEGRGAVSAKLADTEIDGRLELKRGRPFQDLDIKASGSGHERIAAISDKDARLELEHELSLDRQLSSIGSDIDAYVAEKTEDRNRSALTGDPKAGKATFERLSREVQTDLATIEPGGRARSLELGGALIEIARRAVTIGLQVRDRFKLGRDHGLHATIAEEIASEFYGDRIGSAIWYMMVKDAADHFSPDALGSRLLEIFSKHTDMKLVIVGHSAGSIWATELLLERAKLADQPKVDLVLLAPAVRTKKFASMLDVAEPSIDKVRIFAMTDALEKSDSLLGSKLSFLYPSSLLYLVSGLFEHDAGERHADAPLLGMERFIGGERSWVTQADEIAALKRVLAFIGAGPDRMVLTASSIGQGLKCAATSHGGFDDDPDTLASVLTYLV